jgi:hypothetical protein
MRLWPFLAAGICWSVTALAQGVQFRGPPQRPEMPRPENAPPVQGPFGAGLPGGQMPGADPFQLLLNSKQVQADLGLTPHQLNNLLLAAAHNRDKLVESAHRRPGETADQMGAEVQDQRQSINLMIQRELTAQQRSRLQEIMLQLEGPCMAILEPETARRLGVTPDQGRTIAGACNKKSEQMRMAFKPVRPGEDVCALAAENRERIGQIRARADQEIVAMLPAKQRTALTQMMGQKIILDPPVPPNCLR